MRIFRSTTSDQNANTYVGPFGEIVVDDNGLLLIQNNVTPGGTTITVEPATPTVLGGVKLGDGFVLNANNQVTTSILYSTDSRMWVDSAGAYIATDYNAAANQWTFDNEGALIFPGNTLVVGAGNVVNFIGSTDTPLVTFSTGPDSFSQFGWQNSSVSPSNISGIQTDATGVRIGTGAPDGGGPIYQGNIGWTFGSDGITTFPNNILQAPDGSTLEIKTTSGNVYSILNAYNTFTNIGIEDDTTGPNPAWAYLETAMSDVNTPKATVIIRAADTGIGMRWTFSADGNLTIPGNIQTISTGFPFSSNISGINTGSPTVIVTLTDAVFGAAEIGQVTISNVVGTTQANNTWYYASIDPSNFVLYNDAAVTNPVNGNTWTAYIGGGLAVSQGYSNISITGGNVNIVTNTGNTWTFGTDGSLTLPTSGGIVNNGNTWTFGTDGTLTLPGGYAQIEVESDYGVRIGTAALNQAPNSQIRIGGGGHAFEIFGGPPSYSWKFDTDGTLKFPTGNLVLTSNNTSFGNTAAVISSADRNLTTLATGVDGGTSSIWIEDYTSIGTSNIAAVYSNPVPGSKIVRIAVGQNGGAGPKLWDFDNTGNLILPAGGTVSYTPTTASDWSNPPPTTIESALDRLAAVVKVLNGGTGA